MAVASSARSPDRSGRIRMEERNKAMTIRDEQFSEIMTALDYAFNGLFGAMEKKHTDSGSVSLQVKVELETRAIDAVDPESGEIVQRAVKVPRFTYSISQQIALKAKLKGAVEPGEKVTYDAPTGQYVLSKIEDGQQEMKL